MLFRILLLALVPSLAIAAPIPDVTITNQATELLNETVNIDISMSNTSGTATDTGFYPIIEVTLPEDLQLGAGCGAAISITNPAGAPVTCQSFGGFGAGAASYTNPITGEQISIQDDETLIIITLPTGTLAVGQPSIDYRIATSMTADAAVAKVASVTARGIFALGDQANGTRDVCGGSGDTICQSPAATSSITPTVLELDKTTTPVVSNATGPNYPRNFSITADVATGETTTAVIIADTIPDTLIITSPAVNNDCAAFTPVPDTCIFTIDPDGGGSFSATYNTVNGMAGIDITIPYSGHVQEFDNNDSVTSIIPPTTGNATSSQNTATADYTYLAVPATQEMANSTISQRSVDVAKTGAVTTDNAPVGNSPSDVITWTINIWVSDYFSFDDLIIDDDIGDGQTYVAGSYSARVIEGANDITRTQAQLGGFLVVNAKDVSGNTRIDLDLSGALADPAVYNLDDRLDGDDTFSSGNATQVTITYQTTIDENYVDVTGGGNTVVIDGGDTIANDIDIDFRVFGTSNRQDIDDTGDSIEIAKISAITKVTEFKNGGAPGAPPILVATGDEITYKVTLVVPTGDTENLVFTDYLPTPVFSAADPDDDGTAENTLAQIAQGNTAPNAGQWRYTTSSTVTPAPTVTSNANDNSITFDFGDLVENGATSATQTIEFLFTLTATDEPFADGLQLVNLLFAEFADSQQETSIASVPAIADIETESPNLVVAKVANTLVSSAGSINANNFEDVDSGDTLEFLVTITNDGSNSAEDVEFTDVMPAGLASPNGAGNGFLLNVVDGGGGGVCNVVGLTDTSTPTQVAFTGVRITPNGICNVTYRVIVANSANFGDVITNNATVLYAQTVAGPKFSPESDTATTTVELPAVTKTYQNGTSSDALTPDKEIRPGESVDFIIGISVPEGTGTTFRVRERDTSSGNPGSDFLEDLTIADVQFELPAAPGVAATIENDCSNGNPALFNFDGLEDVCFTLNPSLAGNQSQSNTTTYQIDFGTLTNLNTTDGSTETFNVRVNVTAAVNKPGGTYTNRGQVLFTNNQGTQTRTGTDTFILANPELTISKTSATADPLQIGDTIRYVVTVTNSGDTAAFDVTNLIDTLPTGLGNATLVSATYQATDITGQAGFSFSQVAQEVRVAIVNTTNDPDISDGHVFAVTYDVTIQGTLVADSTSGAGHPGGLVDGPGCVNDLTNSADIASFQTGDGGTGRTITAITADTVTKSLDSDGDTVPNSVETVGLSCPDSDGDGVPDHVDTDSDDNDIGDSVEYAGGRDLDGNGTPDYRDNDNDNDSLPDFDELTNAGGAMGDKDGDGIADFEDPDSDNDGIPDMTEGLGDFDGDGIPNYLDLDSDNDGIPDVSEAGGLDANNDGIIDGPDVDNNGLVDTVDPGQGGVALTPPNTDGNGSDDYLDRDSDDDGITDTIEAGGTDANGDGIVDGFTDADSTGWDDATETTPLAEPDTDGDSTPDYQDSDSDGDSVSDNIEGQTDANFVAPSGTDTDGDGIDDSYDSDNGGTPVDVPNSDGNGNADYRDIDADDDGILDSTECSSSPCADNDVDGFSNFRDIDADNDGIVDNIEAQTEPSVAYTPPSNTDTDGDGLDDAYDPDNGGTLLVPVNTDGTDNPDYIDNDAENDGFVDLTEGHDANMNGVADVTPLGTDSDNDGLDDAFDTTPLGPGNSIGSNAPLQDSDGDGIRDFRDTDDDGDGVIEPPGDKDNDGIPDYLDEDSDGDGILDEDEPVGDTDGDGVIDVCDPACTIRGVVLSPGGDGIENASVQTLDSSLSTTTDAEGRFSFPGVGDGEYVFEARLPAGALIGTITTVADDADCGEELIIARAFTLDSPIYFVWNGFLQQVNVVVLTNKSSDRTINATVTMFDIDGVELSRQSIPISPKAEVDLVINGFPGYDEDTYGFIRVEFDNPEFFDGHSARYKYSPDGTLIDFAIIKPFENSVRGTSYALFNTQQPSLDPTQANNQTPQWAQIVNLNPTEWKLFNIRLYDLVGNLILDEPVSIPPLGRRDRQAGHENPGQQQVGLVEIRPRDQSSPYLAQVFRYAADAPAFVFTDRFSFATGVTSLRGIPFTINAPVSNGAGAVTWAAVANVSDTAGTVDVNVIENGGTTVFSTQVEVEARGQRHFNIDSVLPTGASGVVRFTPRDNLRIISETVSYFIGEDGRVSGAGVSPGRFIYAGDYHVAYNSFLGQLNWIRLQNTFNREVTVTIELYDEDGNSLGVTNVLLGSREGRDVELALSLGLPVDPDSYGLVRISSNVTAAVFTTLYRIRLNGVVDLAKPLPGR